MDLRHGSGTDWPPRPDHRRIARHRQGDRARLSRRGCKGGHRLARSSTVAGGVGRVRHPWTCGREGCRSRPARRTRGRRRRVRECRCACEQCRRDPDRRHLQRGRDTLAGGVGSQGVRLYQSDARDVPAHARQTAESHRQRARPRRREAAMALRLRECSQCGIDGRHQIAGRPKHRRRHPGCRDQSGRGGDRTNDHDPAHARTTRVRRSRTVAGVLQGQAAQPGRHARRDRERGVVPCLRPAPAGVSGAVVPVDGGFLHRESWF